MAIDKLKTSSLEDNSVTSPKLAPGAVTEDDIGDSSLPLSKISQVNLDIAPEVLEIQVSAPQAGQDTQWLWTWEQSTLPYARRTITNSPEISVPLYKQGTYTVNNYAAYDIFDQMTQTHSLYLKWIDGAGTDNLVSWATSTGPVSDSHPDINGGSATDVQRINVNVPATITLPTLTAPSVSYTVVNNGAGAYTFSGAAKGDNPNLGPFYRGGTYTIDITATGHPFYFTTDNGTNFSSGTYFGEYTDGVTGSRTDSGTITFTVPNDAPDTLYYQCGNHGVMRGAITVKNLAVETNINGNYVIYFQHTQEGHKTPIELRPIPSLVNQMCLVYDAVSGKFVPQDLATYVENTPSFENKIREVAGTAELVVEDGSAVIAKVNVYDDSTYLPLVGNNPGDQAFATDTDILYIWDGSAWQQAGAANTDDLAEGTTNLFFTDARADARIALQAGSNLDLSGKSTTDLAEGTNLYYTDARVGTYLSSNDYDTATNIVASITDSAPTTLDTLNELAAALGDDPNFATTVTNSIATKLNSADLTKANIDALNIDAATIDSLDSTQFLRSDTNNTFTGNQLKLENSFPSAGGLLLVSDDGTATTVSSGTAFRVTNNGGNGSYSVFESSSGNSDLVHYNDGVLEMANSTGAPILRLTAPGNEIARIELGDGSNYGHISTRPDMGDGILFYENGSNRAILRGGNLGIGTTNPVDKLHIYGNEGNGTMGIVLQDDGWGAPNGQYKLTVRNSDGAFAIRKNTSANFDFATSSDHLVLTSGGGKGKLGINRDTNLDSTVTIEQATDGTDGGIRIYGSDSNSIRGQMYYDGTQSFVIHGTSGPSGEYSTLRFATGVYNNPQIRMSINKDNGNVGIGTTTPSVDLEVSSSTNSFILVKNTTSGSGLYIKADNDGDAEIQTAGGTNNIVLRTSGVERVRIDNNGYVTASNDPGLSYRPSGVTSGTGFKLYDQNAPWAENGGSGWATMQTAVFTAHKNGTVRIRANMYIQSGTYYFKWRIYNQSDGTVHWDSRFDGNQSFNDYEYPAGQSGNVHNPKYYVFDVPDLKAGKRYALEMSPSNSSGSTETSNASQTLYLKEFSVYVDGPQSGAQTVSRLKVPAYNTGTPANNSSNGGILTQATHLNTHINYGVHEKYLGCVQFRANASYLDFRTNLNSNSYMFYMICTGYLYNDGVFNHAMRGGYMYTGNSVINQHQSTPSGSDAWYTFYRDGSGRLCGKLNKGQNGYTEGKVHLYFGTFDSNDTGVYITDTCMNNTTSNIF